jgi:hypothetical protein
MCRIYLKWIKIIHHLAEARINSFVERQDWVADISLEFGFCLDIRKRWGLGE